MGKKKDKTWEEMTDDERLERKKEYAKSALADDRVLGDTAQIILLMDSVEKLKASVELGTESSNKLAKTNNLLTEQTNDLTDKVKNLTKWLLIIGIVAIVIGLSGVVLELINLLRN